MQIQLQRNFFQNTKLCITSFICFHVEQQKKWWLHPDISFYSLFKLDSKLKSYNDLGYFCTTWYILVCRYFKQFLSVKISWMKSVKNHFFKLYIGLYVFVKIEYSTQQKWERGCERAVHSGPENLKKSRQKNTWHQINIFHEIYFSIFPWKLSNFFREIAYLTVLKFFPVQKLNFGHFWNCKKWNLVKKKNSWNWFHDFFWPRLFKIFWPTVLPLKPITRIDFWLHKPGGIGAGWWNEYIFFRCRFYDNICRYI